jgi:tetratricopeptide (TPR) repeat protein
MLICSYCKCPHEAGSLENWHTEEGTVRLFISRTALTCVDSREGELWICQECYDKGVFGGLNSSDIAEVHYQMGLVLSSLSEHVASIRCFEQALHYRPNADTEASLALSYSRIGQIDDAKHHYQRALDLDPGHFMARENLGRIVKREDD